jgi:peptidyl-Asp metalloendopeptidase
MTRGILAAAGTGTVALLALTMLTQGSSAQEPAPLFEPGTALEAMSSAAGAPTVVRSRTARVRFDRLGAAAAAGTASDRPSLLALNLFDDTALTAEFERFETDAFGHQTWVGRVNGDPLSTVTLTWKGSGMSGTVSAHDALFRISALDGVATIEQLDATSFPVELPPLLPPAADRPRLQADDVVRPAAGEVADIFVYYTTAAKNGAGGQAAIESLIAQGVATSNTAYARSGVSATKRLVGTGELIGFVQDASDMTRDLNAFTSSPTVAATRNAVGADLMHLVLDSTSNACGVAWLGPNSTYAHGVTARGCFSGYTFTHEVGHNFGSNHAPDDPVSTSPFRPYSFGYKLCSGATPFRTVMAYACPGGGGTRILNLSNPAVPYNGLGTGSATQNNARSHSEAFPFVQAFRSPVGGTAPSAPLNLQASVAGNTITVSWQAPAQGTPIATYIVRAGTGPGLSNVYDGAVGGVTAVSSPIANGTYYIRVLAQNATGTGPATADVMATVGVPPGVPQNVVASAAGGTITLSWSPPASGGAVSTYLVQAGTAPGSANIFNGAVGAVTTVSGPVGPGTYYLRVLAQGPGGTSAPSSDASVTVGPSCTVPAAPALSGGQSGGVITITWGTPSGGPVTSYTVRAGSGSGQSNLYNSGVGLTNTVSAGVGAGSYFIRVLANSACGSSAESNEALVTVP